MAPKLTKEQQKQVNAQQAKAENDQSAQPEIQIDYLRIIGTLFVENQALRAQLQALDTAIKPKAG